MKRIRILGLSLLLPLCCLAEETNRFATLTKTVAAANQSLQSHDYSNTVRRLFGLTNEAEVASAAIHLQRPECRVMYEQLLAQLVGIHPTLDGEPLRAASFKCPKPIVIGTNSWDRLEGMEVMFIFNGGQWIFYDPSFEKKLGRKMTSRE